LSFVYYNIKRILLKTFSIVIRGSEGFEYDM
jgi:hypothetical protein